MLTVNVPGQLPRGCIGMDEVLRVEADFAGVVVTGDKRGRTLGYPTANIDVADAGSVPADGIYACLVQFEPTQVWCAATLSIGTNPTFDDVRERRIEVFVHDLADDVYGRVVGVKVTNRLRNTIRFNSSAELIARSADDVVRSRAALERFLSGRVDTRSGVVEP